MAGKTAKLWVVCEDHEIKYRSESQAKSSAEGMNGPWRSRKGACQNEHRTATTEEAMAQRAARHRQMERDVPGLALKPEVVS